MLNKIKGVLNIAYSLLYDLPIPMNTVEMYEAACEAGFDGIKGDVTPSADGKLIMCHDAEFYFDENGRVIEPGSGLTSVSSKNIDELTYEECKRLEYQKVSAREHLGYYANVAELEDLIRICSERGKFPYITVRDKQIELCVDEVYRLLVKYNMTNNCIVNSFTFETLQAMRKKDPQIMLSHVWGPDIPLTTEFIDRVVSLGNCVVCMFMWKKTIFSGDVYEKSMEAVRYANEKGVTMHLAIVEDHECYQWGLEHGFTGFQCKRTNSRC